MTIIARRRACGLSDVPGSANPSQFLQDRLVTEDAIVTRLADRPPIGSLRGSYAHSDQAFFGICVRNAGAGALSSVEMTFPNGDQELAQVRWWAEDSLLTDFSERLSSDSSTESAR